MATNDRFDPTSGEPAATPQQTGGLGHRLRNGGTLLALGRVLGMLSVISVYAVLAKIASSEVFALFVLSMSMVTLVSFLAMFGLNTLLCRQIASSTSVGQNTRAGTSANTILRLAGCTILGTGLLLWIGLRYLAVPLFQRPMLADCGGLIALWMVLLAVSQVLAEALRGSHRLSVFGLVGGVSGGLLTMATFLASIGIAYCFIPLEFATLCWLVIASFVAPILFSLWWLRKILPATDGETAVAMQLPVGALLRESFFMMLLTFASVGMDRIGLLILAAYGTDTQVSLFEAAWRLAAFGVIPLNLVNLAIASSIAELHARNDQRRLEQLMRGAATMASVAAIPIILFVALFASPLLSTLFRPSFAPAATTLVVLAVAFLIRSLLGPVHGALMMTGHQTAALVCFLSALPLFLLAPWAISAYGIVGMATLVAVAGTVARVLAFATLRAKLGIWAHASFTIDHLRELTANCLGRPSYHPAAARR